MEELARETEAMQQRAEARRLAAQQRRQAAATGNGAGGGDEGMRDAGHEGEEEEEGVAGKWCPRAIDWEACGDGTACAGRFRARILHMGNGFSPAAPTVKGWCACCFRSCSCFALLVLPVMICAMCVPRCFVPWLSRV